MTRQLDSQRRGRAFCDRDLSPRAGCCAPQGVLSRRGAPPAPRQSSGKWGARRSGSSAPSTRPACPAPPVQGAGSGARTGSTGAPHPGPGRLRAGQPVCPGDRWNHTCAVSRDCLASPSPTPHTAVGTGGTRPPFCAHGGVGSEGSQGLAGSHSSHAAGLRGGASLACSTTPRPAGTSRPRLRRETPCPGPWGPSPTRRPGPRPAGSPACHTSWGSLGCELTPRAAPQLPVADPRLAWRGWSLAPAPGS